MHSDVIRSPRAVLAGLAAAALLLLTGTGTASAALVGAYGFEEASGTAVQDASSSANHGTIAGATRTASGRHGAALAFDGVNDWVTIADANPLDLTGAMTLEAWVNPVALASGSWATVALKERSGNLSYALYANTDTNRPSGHAFIGGVDRDLRGTAAVAVGTWTHLAVTYDGANLRFYVNGTLTTTQARTGAITTGTGALRVGGNGSWGEYFNGRIDELRVYSNALTAAQIATDMATPIGAPTPDTTPPTVAVTAPAANATVSGSVPVAATAADAVGVLGVQFRLDGQPLGGEDTTAPYGVTWPSTGRCERAAYAQRRRARRGGQPGRVGGRHRDRRQRRPRHDGADRGHHGAGRGRHGQRHGAGHRRRRGRRGRGRRAVPRSTARPSAPRTRARPTPRRGRRARSPTARTR